MFPLLENVSLFCMRTKWTQIKKIQIKAQILVIYLVLGLRVNSDFSKSRNILHTVK